MADAADPEDRSSAAPPDADLRGWGRILYELLRILPKNAISRGAGRFAALSLPGWLQRTEIRLFARLAGIDLGETRDPVEQFSSLQLFFTRALRDGARPIEGGELDLVAPCDGAWGASGPIEDGTLLQLKGRSYRAERLLGDATLAQAYEGGTFATFYLSPRDYHRFHTPTAGRIIRIDYHPGALWPVNRVGLQGVDELFAINERICALLEPDPPTDSGAGRSPDAPSGAIAPIALVAVGATMVGSVRLSFEEQTTNVVGALPRRRVFGAHAPYFERGQEWGHFEFGSTIVMLVPPGRYTLDLEPVGRPLRLGQVIGRRLA